MTAQPHAVHQMGRDAERDAVYLAALNGIIANPQFFGPLFQQSPQAAVDFAAKVVACAFERGTRTEIKP